MRFSFSLVCALVASSVVASSTASTEPMPPRPQLPAPRTNAAARSMDGVQFATPNLELSYVPVNPCVVYNTTVTTKFAAGEKRTFAIAGSTNLSAQGGAGSGCGVPASATAVELVVSALNSTVDGFLSANATASQYAYRQVSYIAGHATSNSLKVALANKSFSVFSSKAADTTALVTGYYVPQIQGLIYTGPNPYIYSGSPRILSVTHISTGVVDVTIDRDVSLCSAVVTAFYDKYYYADAKNQGSNMIRIYSWYLSSTTSTTTPIYIDNDVYLAVHC